MDSLGNKDIFSRNLRRLMQRFGKDRNQICDDLSFKYSTFNDWYNGKKYPRIDKIEMLANYFGVLKSDLIEEKEKEKPVGRAADEMEEELLNLCSRLTPAQKQRQIQILRDILGVQDK